MPKELRKDEELSKEEWKQLVDEVMGWEPTEEETQEMLRQHNFEMRERRLRTMVFDTGSGKKITLREFERFYDTDEFSRELVEAAKKKEQYSKETAGKIKALYSKLTQPKVVPITREKVESKPTAQRKPKATIRDQFIRMKYDFIEKVKGAGCHHNPTTLLMILLKHRTWPGKMDKHHTFTYWYREKGLIVASRSIESLAEELGTCERTVRKYLKQLDDNGDIKIEKGEKFGSRRENVYVLGTVDRDGNELLYHTLPK